VSTLAVNGGEPVRRKPWPPWPVWGERELELLREVLESGYWGGGVGESGPWEKRLEEAFARRHGCRYGIAVSSGTAALHVAMLAAGVGPGDEVVVPALTYWATGAAALMCGATVVIVDVDPETLCMDTGEVERALSEQTKALVPVYNYGSAPDMDAMRKLADERGLYLIEDCARSHGFEWSGRPVGSIGDAGCFSFQQSKFLTAGEGGIVVTNSEELAEKCYALKDCGRVRGRAYWEGGRYWLNWYNYRMTQFQAAILLAQLERFDEQLKRRQENSEYLSKRLSEIEGVEPVKVPQRLTKHQPWPYAFKYDPKAFGGVPVWRFVEALKAEGVPAGRIDHPPLLETLGCAPPGKVIRRGRYTVAKTAVERLVTIPQHVFLADKSDMDDIVEAVLKIRKNARAL
jgi:dTDP-4-amino-4,6-dideoxygalactose transaminase